MRTRSWLATLLSLLLLPAITGCGLMDRKHQVGERYLRWTQSTDGDLGRVAALGTIVIAGQTAREDFVDVAPPQADIDAINRVRLDSSFLVIASFHRCQQESRLWMDDDRTAVWMEVYQPRAARGVACVWSPMTVDIYRVNRSELGEARADRLKTSAPRR